MTFLQLVYFYVLMVVFTFQNITDATEELCLFICMPLLSTQTRGWGYWEGCDMTACWTSVTVFKLKWVCLIKNNDRYDKIAECQMMKWISISSMYIYFWQIYLLFWRARKITVNTTSFAYWVISLWMVCGFFFPILTFNKGSTECSLSSQ